MIIYVCLKKEKILLLVDVRTQGYKVSAFLFFWIYNYDD